MKLPSERKRVRPGDVLEVVTPAGIGYLHYAFRAPPLGDHVRVLAGGVHAARPADFSRLVAAPEAYWLIWPVQTAANQGLAAIVANEPVPASASPIPYRVAGQLVKGEVRTWHINYGDHWEIVTSLTPEQQRIGPLEFWSHDVVVHRLATGWDPSQPWFPLLGET